MVFVSCPLSRSCTCNHILWGIYIQFLAIVPDFVPWLGADHRDQNILLLPLICPFTRIDRLQVSWTANIGAFLREIYSVNICAGATVDGQLYVRQFSASHMTISPITVGRRANAKSGSVVYGGTTVGEHW